MTEWKDADRISDQIVDMLNKELETVSPTEILAGVFLALLGYLEAAPRDSRPPSLLRVEAAVRLCLRSILGI